MEKIILEIEKLKVEKEKHRKNLEAFSPPLMSKDNLLSKRSCPLCGRKPSGTAIPVPADSPFSDEFYAMYYPCGHYEHTQMEIARLDNSISALWRANVLYDRCNLGEKFLEKTFDSYQWKREPQAFQACIKYARGFDKYLRGGRGLLLSSSGYGNGKTHLAGAIIHEVIERHLVKCIFVRGCDMVEDVQRAKWGKPGKFSIKTYENCDLLVIDDIAKEGVTVATAKAYWRIIDYRVLNRKPMILTTNYSALTLLDACDDASAIDTWSAVIDRLASVCKSVIFTGGSYRREVEARVA